jgi:hypothetical protein
MLGITLALLAQAAAVPLPATGKWILEGDNNMCALLRTFGEGRNQITLGIRPWPLGGRADILVFTPDNSEGLDQGYEQLSFDAGAPAKVWYQSYEIQNKYVRLHTATFDDVALAPAATAKELDVVFGEGPAVRLALPDMTAGLKALDNCKSLLLKSLGVDPDWQAKIATAPVPTENPSRWFSSKDYPDSALMYGGQGLTRMLITVGTDGRVMQCVNFGSSGNAKMDAAACKGFQTKGRFNPARDMRGRPIVGYFVFGLNFHIIRN